MCIVMILSSMHVLGFDVMPRRIPDFLGCIPCWSCLSPIGSGITVLAFAMLFLLRVMCILVLEAERCSSIVSKFVALHVCISSIAPVHSLFYL